MARHAAGAVGAGTALRRAANHLAAAGLLLPILFLTPGALPGSTMASPPALAIFSAADLLNLCAETFSFLLISPLPRIFNSSYRPLTNFAAVRDSGLTASP